jgi:hypothetical protein
MAAQKIDIAAQIAASQIAALEAPARNFRVLRDFRPGAQEAALHDSPLRAHRSAHDTQPF